MLPNLAFILIAARWWIPAFGLLLHMPADAGTLVIVHLVATAASAQMQQALQAVKLPRLAAALHAAERAALLLSLAALAALGLLSWTAAAWAYVLSPLLASVAALWQLRPFVTVRPEFDSRLLRDMLRFSAPLIPYSAIGYFSTQYLDAVFITRFLSEAELAVYWVAFQLAGAVMQLPLLAGSLLFPYFITLEATSQKGGVTRYFTTVLPALTLVWSTLCALWAAAGSHLLHYVFGPGFARLGAPLWPLMAAGAVAAPHLMGYAPLTNARSATYVAAVGAAVAAAVNVTLNAVLIPRWGLGGCAWATAGSYVACLTATICLARKFVEAPSSWIAPALSPALVGAAVAAWKPRGLEAVGAALVVAALVGILWRTKIRELLSRVLQPRFEVTQNLQTRAPS